MDFHFFVPVVFSDQHKNYPFFMPDILSDWHEK
jgi:hypothetical protein